MNKKTNTKVKSIRTRNIVLTIITILLVTVLGTYAWLSYRSKNTAMVLTVGDINNIQITLSPYQLNLNLTPKLTLDTSNNNTDYITVTVTNSGSEIKNFSLFYDIHEIYMGLQNSNFRYTIIRTNDSNTTTGNFASANTTNDFYILNANISPGTTYTYKVYTWLYGNESNSPGLAFKGDLRASF